MEKDEKVAFKEAEYPSDYLGDGVYASFDGYQIWLAVNSHENAVVALEPAVMHALKKYEQRIIDIVEGTKE